MSTTATGHGVMTTLKQTVANLDSQRDQLMAAIERDYPRVTAPVSHNLKHDELHDFFTELARAREHLVTAHNLLRDVVSPIDLARESRS